MGLLVGAYADGIRLRRSRCPEILELWPATSDMRTWKRLSYPHQILLNIRLSDQRLTGEIPLELGQLTDLNVLNINGNQLLGGVPAALGQLVRLVAFSLISNQLIGGISLALEQLTLLRILSLDYTQAMSVPTGGKSTSQQNCYSTFVLDEDGNENEIPLSSSSTQRTVATAPAATSSTTETDLPVLMLMVQLLP